MDQIIADDREIRSSSNSQTASGTTGPCLCAPTKHPGSFRCRLHRRKDEAWGRRSSVRPPMAEAKPARTAKSPSTKAGDSISLRMTPSTRTYRTRSEALKLRRNEPNQAMVVAGQGVPKVVAAIAELSISPVDIAPKKSKINVAPIYGPKTVPRASIKDKGKAAVTDVATAKVQKQVNPQLQHKVDKRASTLRERRLRARSDDVVASLVI